MLEERFMHYIKVADLEIIVDLTGLALIRHHQGQKCFMRFLIICITVIHPVHGITEGFLSWI